MTVAETPAQYYDYQCLFFLITVGWLSNDCPAMQQQVLVARRVKIDLKFIAFFLLFRPEGGKRHS